MFITVMAAFLFSKPEELGLDPTVTTSVRNGKQAFIYELIDTRTQEKIYFQTIKTISEYHSYCISGRKTRVWRVKRIHSLGDPTFMDNMPEVVLKDLWLDADAPTERNIQDDVFKDIEEFAMKRRDAPLAEPPEFTGLSQDRQQEIDQLLHADTYKRHFLTITHDHIGSVSKNITRDSIADPTMLYAPDKKITSARSPVVDRSRGRMHSTRSSMEVPAKPERNRTFLAKRQYRVVFLEICTAMHGVKNFRSSLEALRGAVLGISLFVQLKRL